MSGSRDNRRVLRFETDDEPVVWVWVRDGTVWRYLERYDAPVVRDVDFLGDALHYEEDALLVALEYAPEHVRAAYERGDADE